jgi:hypothetical protein
MRCCQSDTASVLHEALGYIRFLHDQVQVRRLLYITTVMLPPSLPRCIRTSAVHDAWYSASLPCLLIMYYSNPVYLYVCP